MNNTALEILIRNEINNKLQKVRDAYEASDGLKVYTGMLGTLVLDHIATYTSEVRLLKTALHHLDDVELVYKHFGKEGLFIDEETTDIEDAKATLLDMDGGISTLYVRYKNTEIMIANVELSKYSSDDYTFEHNPVPFRHYPYSGE